MTGIRRVRNEKFLTAILVLFFSLFARNGYSQINPGVPSFSAYDSHEVDTINLQNLDILLTTPFMSKSGAFPFRYVMAANSYMTVNSGTWQPGISYGGLLGSASGMLSSTGPTLTTTITCPDGVHLTNKYANWVVWSADGTSHPLPLSDYVDFPIQGNGNAPCYKGSFVDQTIDGSGYTVTADIVNCKTYSNGLCSVTHKSGFHSGFMNLESTPAVTDSNGNQVVLSQIQTHTGTFTDTLGLVTATESTNLRVHDFLFGGTFTWTDVNGGSPQVSVTASSTFHLKSVFGCTGITDYDYATYNLPISVSFPENTTIGLSYESTPGHAGDYTGRLSSVTLRSGGTITYGYSAGLNCSYRTPAQLTRTTSDGTTTYTWAAVNNGSGNWGNTTTVVDQGGNKTVYTFTGLTATGNAALPITQALTQVQTYQSSNTLLSTTLICYNNNFSNCTTAAVSLPILKRDVYTYPAGMTLAQARLTEQTFDTYGNVLTDSEYDYNQTLVSTTTTTYGSWNAGQSQCVAISSTISDKPCDVVTKIGTNTVAESRYVYDSHGNLLTVYRWTGSTWLSNSTPNSYNSNGTVATSYDLANNPTSYSYSAGSYSSCGTCTNFPFPTSISQGGLTTYTTWNGIGGVKLTDKEASGNVTTYGYTACSSGTAEPFWRVESVTDPLGSKVCKTYPSGSAPDSTNSSFSFNSNNSIQNVTKTTDGFGRTVNVQTQQAPSSPNYDTQSTTYGWAGNYRSVLNIIPCSTSLGASCTGSGVTTLTGPLGRPYTITDGGGQTTTNTYSQNDVLTVLGPAPAGENVKQVQKQYDGLGRIQYSCAVGNGSSTACNQNTGTANGVTTSYAYGAGAGSTTMTVTRGSQSRIKTYDAMGRVTSETRPETGTTTYLYDAYPGGACGASFSNPGDLVLTTRANGDWICYIHDGLHRLTDVGSGGPDASHCQRFRYDNSSGVLGSRPTGVTVSNTLGRLVEAETDNCSWPITQASILTDEWFSYDADGRLTDVYESTPHSGGYYHTTAQYWENGTLKSLGGVPGYTNLTYGIDGEGRLSTAQRGTLKIVCDSTCSLSSTTYDAGGRPLVVKIGGTADNDTYTYDANTVRMKTYTFTVGSTPKSIAGTLTWNSNGTLRTLAITDGFNSGGTETCNYGTSTTMGYDDLGRLLSVDCSSSPAWAQTFSYDQYDNITKTGSISWACASCYDATTNRYNSTLSPSISYDNDGNLLNDTFNKYTWDAFGHPSTIVSVSGSVNCGSSGTCITYDALGRMVEKSSNSVYYEILYSPVGKTAIMSGTTTSSAYYPLPAGETYQEVGSTGGSSYFWHKDWLGSVRFASGIGNRSSFYDRAFAPYGEMYNNFGNTSGLNFTGDTQDTISGTFDTPERELNPNQGRWISPDPAGAGWNQYAYTTNPNTMIDPSGLNNCRDPKGPGCGSPVGGTGFLNSDFQDPTMAFGALQVFASVPANSSGAASPQLCLCPSDLTSGVMAGTAAPLPATDFSGMPFGTGAPAEIIIGGFMFSFNMLNCCDSAGKLVFPGYSANDTMIGNAYYLQVANDSGQPLAGTFSVTENVTPVSATRGINPPSGSFTWLTNSSGGFVDNIFVGFSNIGIAFFQDTQRFTINGVPGNSFNQFYGYYGGLQFANPWPKVP
jgi:RHS repeat-associated protein